MLLENKNAMIYGWGEFISGAVARTFANFTSGTFPSYMTSASMATQRQRNTVGDDVLGFADGGGYAEYALATAAAPKPEGLGWAAAVALPVAAETAQRVLGLLEVARGDTVLIHGASGAVGTVAVQIATARGATVIGTANRARERRRRLRNQPRRRQRR